MKRFAVFSAVVLVTIGAGVGAESIVRSGPTTDQAVAQAITQAKQRLQARIVDVAGPRELVVANLHGIYRTTDLGQRWRDITPSTFTAQQSILLSHLFDIDSFGSRRIWLQLDGDERFDFVPYSWNGGESWSTAKLPGDANNPSSLKFSSANDGSLVANYSSTSRKTAVYRTTNGGRSWTLFSFE